MSTETPEPATGVGPRDQECLFCRLLDGQVPADVVAENDRAVAFRDIDPKAPVHVLVIPRAHHADVAALAAAAPDDLVAVVRLGSQVAQDECGGQFRLVFNSGPAAQQTVFHVHGHVLGGRDMTWPPG
jgi:histidine triad (HIT) family protein